MERNWHMAVRLTYHQALYLGKSIRQEKLEKIKEKLEKKPLSAKVFLIAISRNPIDQLEIYQAKQLAQRYYEKYPPYVVGIAGDYNEAVEMVEKLVQECLKERGDCALKEYLLCGT
ncbi:MAG: hypothetical protein NC432_05920 [Roseburia sp.]|nr:hypothetical protein [Roseburia sp.]MCM1098842.1 hypothetical protein [Ruminococcus flavefaciens]